MDVLTREQRRRCMSQVKGKDTKPEVLVRRLLHGMGYRFRLHAKDLPGRPDVVMPRHRKIVQVHGCFWHGHRGCRRATRPSTNVDFWSNKIEGNQRRDVRTRRKLRSMGWEVLVIWQCQTRDRQGVEKRLERFMSREAAA